MIGIWEKIKLGSVCELKGGFAFKSKDFLIEGIPLVKISNIQNNKTVKTDSDVYINTAFVETLKDFVLKENDVVIAMSGATTGKIGKVTKNFSPSFLNQRVGFFKAKDESKVDTELIFQIFSQDSLINHILGNAGSSAQPNISPGFIEDIEIDLPSSKPEQTRIAEILITADTAIAQTEALVDKYQRIKTGLMQDLLSRGIDANGNIRSKATHKFVVKKGIEVPEEWEVKEIGDCVEITTGGKDTQDKVDDGEYSFFVRSQTVESINSYSFDGEGVLTSGDGVGVGKIYHYINGKFDFHQRVYLMYNFKKDEMYGRYFFEYFLNNFFNEVSKYSAKTTVDSVRLDMIARMLILVPPYDEQILIANTLSETDVYIEKETNHLNKLHSLKTGLMQDLLSGRVRVKIKD